MGNDIYWQRLRALDSTDVATRSGARFVESGIYEIQVLNTIRTVNTLQQTITPRMDSCHDGVHDDLEIALLRYLIECKAIDPIGEWVGPHQLKSGHFFRGHHAAPVIPIARHFGEDRALFEKASQRLGGKREAFADSAFSFLFLPRIPVMVLLWLKDDEFEARAGMLVDRAAEIHLPSDALLAVLLVMEQQLVEGDQQPAPGGE